MEIRFVDEKSQDERFIVFSKNRRGHVGKPLYFDLSATGDVTYDIDRFKKTEELKELKKVEKDKVKESGKAFDVLFGIAKDAEVQMEEVNVQTETATEITAAISPDKKGNKKTVTIDGQSYPSIAAAVRGTGLSYTEVHKRANNQ